MTRLNFFFRPSESIMPKQSKPVDSSTLRKAQLLKLRDKSWSLVIQNLERPETNQSITREWIDQLTSNISKFSLDQISEIDFRTLLADFMKTHQSSENSSIAQQLIKQCIEALRNEKIAKALIRLSTHQTNPSNHRDQENTPGIINRGVHSQNQALLRDQGTSLPQITPTTPTKILASRDESASPNTVIAPLCLESCQDACDSFLPLLATSSSAEYRAHRRSQAHPRLKQQLKDDYAGRTKAIIDYDDTLHQQVQKALFADKQAKSLLNSSLFTAVIKNSGRSSKP